MVFISRESEIALKEIIKREFENIIVEELKLDISCLSNSEIGNLRFFYGISTEKIEEILAKADWKLEEYEKIIRDAVIDGYIIQHRKEIKNYITSLVSEHSREYFSRNKIKSNLRQLAEFEFKEISQDKEALLAEALKEAIGKKQFKLVV